MNVTLMSDLDLNHKRVLIREDLNVPIRNGLITSDKRILAALPTIEQALAQNAAVIILSHLGRPTEGMYEEKFSLQVVADYLSDALKRPVRLEKDYLDGVEVHPGEVVLCENVRFNMGEKANDESLAKKLAELCDIFVMDAFGTAHRAHASTAGVAKYAKVACAGPLLQKELSNLSRALKEAESPIIAVVGGAKVSTKLTLLSKLIDKVDTLILGGGIV
jgi:phosphoglycerate kinase